MSYRYTSTTKRNPNTHVVALAYTAIVYIIAKENEAWYSILLTLLYPLYRITKPVTEWVEIGDSEIMFSPEFLNTGITKLRSNQLKFIERLMERTITQGKYGPITHDDWTINFHDTTGKIHRTADVYPPKFNHELYQFCTRNGINRRGIENTIFETNN